MSVSSHSLQERTGSFPGNCCHICSSNQLILFADSKFSEHLHIAISQHSLISYGTAKVVPYILEHLSGEFRTSQPHLRTKRYPEAPCNEEITVAWNCVLMSGQLPRVKWDTKQYVNSAVNTSVWTAALCTVCCLKRPLIIIIMDCFYIAVFSALVQTHCTQVACDSEWVTVSFTECIFTYIEMQVSIFGLNPNGILICLLSIRDPEQNNFKNQRQ